ncbi:MAG: YwiC-like family protein, partial [Pyrinomonadaceae bacterium]
MEKRGAGRGVRVRTLALPVEHGGWGLTLEPVALGLLVAPSPVGLFLSVATMGAFLARHPLKIVAGDRRRGRRFPRTPVAERCAAIYAAVAAAGLLFAVLMADGYTFLWPLLLAAPLASVQLVYDAKGESRSLWPELAGATALAGVATSIALAGGWKSVPAYG